MMPPLSAMPIRSATLTGAIAKATAAAPESTRSTSASGPRIPPTNPIRSSVRGSPIASSGARTWSWSSWTSSRSAGGRPVRRRHEMQRVPLAREVHGHVAGRGRRVRAGRELDVLAQALQERLRGVPGQVRHDPVIRQDLGLVVGEGDGEERVRLDPADAGRALPEGLAGAHGARGPMVAVRDVQGRDGGERGDQVAITPSATRQTVCWTPSAAVKSKSGVAGRRLARPPHPRRRRPDRSGRPVRSGPAGRGCAASGRPPCPCGSVRACG